MRVLMFTTDYLPNIGGVAVHVHELAKAMCGAGHDVTVLTNVPDGDATISSADSPGVLRVSEQLRWLPVSKARRLQFAMNLIPLTFRDLQDYDFIHFHTVDPLSRMLSPLWGRWPQIATNHTSMFVADSSDPQRVVPWQRFFRRMDGVLAPSRELESLTAAVTGTPEKVRYIPNGVDAAKFNPEISGQLCRERYGVKREEKLILCARRLVHKNGCVLLARALRNVFETEPSARVLFVGDGPERGQVEKELEAAGCLHRALFAGSVPNSDMPAVYAAGDVVVVPSLIEATSISVLEAMATARPVVAHRIGGLPALIEDAETGLLVESGDEEGLAAAICALLADRDQRTHMGAKARSRVLEQFTWDRIAASTVDACKTLLTQSTSRAA